MHKLQTVYNRYMVYQSKRFTEFHLGGHEGASNIMSINTSQRGLRKGWTRNTFILRKVYLEKIKALAYWERKTIKEVMDEMLGSHLREKD
jgi:hypothetical protein